MLGLVEVLRAMVGDLETIRYRGGPGSGGEQIRGELQAYLSALGRAESVLSKIIALDLDSRRLRLDEAKATFIVAALAKVLGHRDLELSEDRQRRARALLAQELVEKKSSFPNPPRPRSPLSSESQVFSPPLAPEVQWTP